MTVKNQSKFKLRDIVQLALVATLVVSLLMNITQYLSGDKLSADQIKQIAYGRFVKDCFELSTNKEASCKDTKVDAPQWYSGRDGEGWVVDSACFTPNGQAADCANFQPTND
jgi:hypothetical protein